MPDVFVNSQHNAARTVVTEKMSVNDATNGYC